MGAMPHQLLIWCCCLLLVQLATALTGDNVCKRLETSSETIGYVVKEPVTFRIYTWCLKMPPRCSKYTTIMKERLKTKVQENNHTIDFCCDGYTQLETYCVPECNRTECPHMRCDANKVCICEAGFHGQRCHMGCRPGYWGENCKNKCVCNGEPCDTVSGDCLAPVTKTTPSPTSPIPSEVPEVLKKGPTTPAFNLNKQILPVAPVTSTTHATVDIVESSEEESDEGEEEYTDLDVTVIPDGMSWDDIRTTLLPEDEVIIVYPNFKQTPTSTKAVEKTTRATFPATTRTTPTFHLPSEIVTKVPYYTEKQKKPTPTKTAAESNWDKIKLSEYLKTGTTTEQTKIFDTAGAFKTMINNNFKTSSGKKHTDPTATTGYKHSRYFVDGTLPKKGNGLPPPVPDGSDNSLRLRNGDNANTNTTFLEEIDSHNSIRSNELQRDTGGIYSNNNYNKTNTEETINSSLVRAKWDSAFDTIDFNSPSIMISATVTMILSLVLIVVIITHWTRKIKIQTTSFYDDNVKSCHDNGLICSGHYTSPGGQPVFFCPAFTNSYAFELAQELREAHYDHPRSARCLSNEPVYAELQY